MSISDAGRNLRAALAPSSDFIIGDSITEYIMDLEALVRWLALTFSYMEYDPNDPEDEGTLMQNEPIWTVYDERGTHLPAAEKLQETWNKVMHDG